MRRAARNAGVAAAVAAITLANVSATGVGDVLGAVGLGQAWSVFAPDPIASRVVLEADVRFADGTIRRWRPPELDPLLQEAGYRWQHWARAVVLDERSELWEPAARWIARAHTRAGRRPVRVTLRRRFARLPPPGARDRRPRLTEFDFYTLDLR